MRLQYAYKSLVFHPKSNVLLVASADNSIWLWNCYNGNYMNGFFGHTDSVNNARFTPDGKLIVSVSNDESLKIWRVTQEKEKLTIASKRFHMGAILSLDFHNNWPLVITGGADKVFCISNYDSGDVYFKSPEFEDVIESVCISSRLFNKS